MRERYNRNSALTRSVITRLQCSKHTAVCTVVFCCQLRGHVFTEVCVLDHRSKHLFDSAATGIANKHTIELNARLYSCLYLR